MVDDAKPSGTERLPHSPAPADDPAKTAVDPPQERGDEATPRMIGRFEILSLLGKGGMARVYRAFDPSLDRSVALKVLHAPEAARDADGDRQRKRIVREARAAAALTHPNTVTIYEVGEADGHPYIAMELLDGATLRASVQKSTPRRDRLRWLLEAARALFAAHGRGLVHRDVKPDNMIVDADGRLRLLDFGIAKRDYGDAEAALEAIGLVHPDGPSSLRTVAGRQLGTPRYMAPEQRVGESTDARTDQYAWGLVACEVLGAGVPKPDDDVGARLRELGLPEELVATIVRATAPRKEDRWPTLEPVIAALERLGAQATAPATEIASTVASSPVAATLPMTNAVTLDEPAAVDTPPARAPRARTLVIAAVLASTLAVAGTALVVTQKKARATATKASAAPPASCAVAAALSVGGVRPKSLALLPDHRVVVELAEITRDVAEPGVVILDATDRDAATIEPLASVAGPRMELMRTMKAPGQEAVLMSLFVRRVPDVEHDFSLVTSWQDHQKSKYLSIGRIELTASGMAIAPFRGGRLAALTFSAPKEGVGAQPVVFGAAFALAVPSLPPKVTRTYETTTPVGLPALATTEAGAAMVFRHETGLLAIFVNGSLEGLGPPLTVTRASAGQPAVTYVGETLVVVWPSRDGGVTHLHAASLRPGAPAFDEDQRLFDDVVTDEPPVFVPLEDGTSLLAWVSVSRSGKTVRAARFTPAPSSPFDVPTPGDVRAVTALASDRGASLAWIDERFGGVRLADVTCDRGAVRAAHP